MVIFTDYQCPFCKNFETQTFAEIKKNWIDTGKLRYVVRDHPLDFHPYALKAAEATRCAAEQGRYWELREKLIVNAEQLQRERLPAYAKEAGLDVGRFDACLDAGKYAEKIKAEVIEANGQGINGTPSFIIGRSDGKTIEGALLVGAMPYAVFNGKLNELLPK
jgi:protein-disulfide isomerase